MRACKIDEGWFKPHEVERAYRKEKECDVEWPGDVGICRRLNCISDLCHQCYCTTAQIYGHLSRGVLFAIAPNTLQSLKYFTVHSKQYPNACITYGYQLKVLQKSWYMYNCWFFLLPYFTPIHQKSLKTWFLDFLEYMWRSHLYFQVRKKTKRIHDF